MARQISGLGSLFMLMVMLIVGGATACSSNGGNAEAVGRSTDALCSSATLTSSAPTYTAAPGQTVIWTGSGSCAATAQYAFNLRGTNGVFTRIQDWSPSPQWTWDTTGLPTGQYYVEVLISDASGTPTTYDRFASAYFDLTTSPPCTAVSTAVSPANQAAVGGTVTFASTATGCGTPEYRIVHIYPNGTAVEASPYSTANSTWTWDTSLGGPASAPGNHYFEVWVRAVGSPARYDSYQPISYTLLASTPCTGGSVAVSPPNAATIGAHVTFTSSATGCGAAEYRIVHQYPNGTFVEASPYSTSNATWTWDTSQGGAANAAGTHYFEVWMRAVGSTQAYEAYRSTYYTLQSSPPCTSTTLTISPVNRSPSGTLVNLSMSATGCISPTYKYRVYLTNGTWLQIQDWTASPTATWNTSLLPAGSYYVEVWARAASSTATYESWAGSSYLLDAATSTPTALVGGMDTYCLLKSSGQVDCWGYNVHGELGTSAVTATLSAVPVANQVTDGVGLAAGYSHQCALASAGVVKCWGYNFHGQVGNGTTTTATSPVAVSGITSAVSVAAGNSHSCAVLSDGTMKCWGYNSQGQLGSGLTADSLAPVSVNGISTAAKAAAGYYHSCALLRDGTVRCWGSGTLGQLGNGLSANSLTPVAVSGLSGVTALALASNSSCALKSDGTVWCWGYNGAGNLGDGTTTNRSTPIQVSGISSATNVAVNQDHGCAALANNTVMCWGTNDFGQLGNGTTTSSLVPVAVSTITTAVGVAIGDHNSCAILSDGTAECWGYDGAGGLGNGSTTTTDQSSPVAVSALP